MVSKKTLLSIASTVWMVAGFNIMKIGFESYVGHISFIHLICSWIIFCLFWFFIFNKLVNKHTLRINGYTEKQYFWKFFDFPSFIIMAFMMTLGIVIRNFQLMPTVCIGIFYSGLGVALFGAGLKFMKNRIVGESL